METYKLHFGHLYEEADLFATDHPFAGTVRPDAFKRVAQERAAEKMSKYARHLFDCDFLLWAWLNPMPGFVIFRKEDMPDFPWDPARFSFSREPETWNESCSVRYDDVPIGEWQVHEHRSNYKFRFNLPNLARVLASDEEN